MKPSVPVEVRRTRAKELEAIAAANHEKFARSLIGQEVEVCVERDGNGRTDEYVRCLLKGTAPRRSLVRAVVDDYFPKTGSLSATIRA
jgi:tRNA A37 methylthiotransferase MiaB